MFKKRRRKREVEHLKAHCPHEWHSILKYEETVYNGYDVDFYDAVTLYCPICDATKDLHATSATKILNMQKIRSQYEKGADEI